MNLSPSGKVSLRKVTTHAIKDLNQLKKFCGVAVFLFGYKDVLQALTGLYLLSFCIARKYVQGTLDVLLETREASQ